MTSAGAAPVPRPSLSAEDTARYREQGFVVVRGLLSASDSLAALRSAYGELINELGRRLLEDRGASLLPGFEERPFVERFSIALGASGGSLLDHLDPQLPVGRPGFRHRSDWPSAQLPGLFDLIREPRILDAVEGCLGAELEASSIHHFNLKLAERHRALAADAARACGHGGMHRTPYLDFHVNETIWHCDAPYGLPDAFESDILIAWIPLTRSTPENGGLRVLPGSHRSRPDPARLSNRLRASAVDLELEPGDVLLMDNHTLHASSPNRSADDFRWSISLRYLPTGQANGRPYLPGFVVRSREPGAPLLRDGALWAAMWRAALLHAERNPRAIPSSYGTGLRAARGITRAWRERTPDAEGWLALEERDAPSDRLRRAFARIADRISR